jgi:hypothetical protein
VRVAGISLLRDEVVRAFKEPVSAGLMLRRTGARQSAAYLPPTRTPRTDRQTDHPHPRVRLDYPVLPVRSPRYRGTSTG